MLIISTACIIASLLPSPTLTLKEKEAEYAQTSFLAPPAFNFTHEVIDGENGEQYVLDYDPEKDQIEFQVRKPGIGMFLGCAILAGAGFWSALFIWLLGWNAFVNALVFVLVSVLIGHIWFTFRGKR